MRRERQLAPLFRSSTQAWRLSDAGRALGLGVGLRAGGGPRRRRRCRRRAGQRGQPSRCTAGAHCPSGRPPGRTADTVAVGTGRPARISPARSRAPGHRPACHPASHQLAAVAAGQRGHGAALGCSRWPYPAAGAGVAPAAVEDAAAGAATDARAWLPATHCARGGRGWRTSLAALGIDSHGGNSAGAGSSASASSHRAASSNRGTTGNCGASDDRGAGGSNTTHSAICASRGRCTGDAAYHRAVNQPRRACSARSAWRTQHRHCRGRRPWWR